MSKWSVKIKLTAWYTAMMTLIVVLAFAALSIGANTLQMHSMERTLTRAVTLAADELDHEDGEIEFEAQEILELFDEVDFLVYDLDGSQLYGHPPAIGEPFAEERLKRVSSGSGSSYLIYDKLVTFKKHSDVWLRGIAPLSVVEDSARQLRRVALFTLPVMILMAALVGYLLVRRALHPIDLMTKTAKGIAGGDDLAQRLPVPIARDEIGELAATFNGMFARLGESFAKERQLVADMAHELRTPLSVIAAQSEYALDQATSAPEKEAAIRIIQETSGRMANQISHLLQLARMDRGTHPFKTETLCLTELLEGIVQEMREAAQSKEIDLQGELAPNVMMRGDQMLLMRMYLNLISNAISYGKPGGYVIVRLRIAGDQIISAIEDNGIGIAPDNLPRIWDRYYRADSARDSSEGHAGLGLSIVRSIVTQHGGQIHVESVLGQGSTFTLRFPKS